MNNAKETTLRGQCTCGAIQYEMTCAPLIVHCCHCRWCQRETGASYALNALIEANRVTLLEGVPVDISTPSESGNGQSITRCPNCHVAVWSRYNGAGDAIVFIRVGTLDQPDLLPPDIHIYTRSKQPWVSLSTDIPSVPEYYRRSEYWTNESLERRKALLVETDTPTNQ